ncbi:hypothetical protein C7I55_03555 [Sphingomonas deserti]|uniref:Uncharacterized protein n=1 Tax=Allosphingosinicella deserti TaxID=2116704 RepID=A0A2P7QZQ5_9SPHN|nr:hypothetical protein C7I55_03555 [Sphingomonas deserti]
MAICTSLIEGESREANDKRRLGLILGRAIHQIEAKNYQEAINDVALARREAEAAALTDNPYFMRSRGLAFDLVESAALVRMGRTVEARDVSLRNVAALQYSLFPLLTTPTFADLIPTMSDDEDRLLQWQSRLAPTLAQRRADRLDLARRFADSARVHDAFVEFDAEHSPELNSSLAIARAAVAHGLAGNHEAAAERAQAARTNAEARKIAGKPEDDTAEFVEMMDLYEILQTERRGDIGAARRLFAARSQWVGASLGSVMEVNRRLRQGASPEELIGGLASDSDALWRDRSNAMRAALVANDDDNKTLFALTPGLRPSSAYEALSKNVWRVDKSKLVLKLEMLDSTKTKMELLFLPLADPATAMEGYVLHAALLAKSRGHNGFVFTPLIGNNIVGASFRSGNRGEKGFPEDLFISAEDVIAKLSAVIPDPVELQQRRENR